MKHMLITAWSLTLSLGLSLFDATAETSAGAGGALTAPRKKIISLGWAKSTPKDLTENLTLIENGTPYDGMHVHLVGEMTVEGATKKYTSRFPWQHESWPYEAFADSISYLQGLRPNRPLDLFILTTTRSGPHDWLSDEYWAHVCHNFGLIARIARETGCRGIIFDPEDYQDSGHLFAYSPDSGVSYEAMKVKARQRGREWISALGNAYPDMTLFALFWASLVYPFGDNPNDIGNRSCALFPAFLNGVYDALPPGMTIVDGHESYFYRSGDRHRVMHSAGYFRANFRQLIAPENLGRALSQTQMAAAMYLDAFFPATPDDPKNRWDLYPGENDTTRLRHFRNVLFHCLAATDEYVWTWGERVTWWPQNKADALNQRLPGLNTIMRSVKSVEEAEAVIAAMPAYENLLANGDFETAPAPGEQAKAAKLPAPAGWNVWDEEREERKGVFYASPGAGGNGSTAMTAAGFVRGGCAIANVAVQPGDILLLRGKARCEENATGEVTAAWKRTATGGWVWDNYQAPLVRASLRAVPGSEWRECKALLMVPDHIEGLGLQLGVGRQRPGQDKIHYDDFEVIRLPPFPPTTAAP